MTLYRNVAPLLRLIDEVLPKHDTVEVGAELSRQHLSGVHASPFEHSGFQVSRTCAAFELFLRNDGDTHPEISVLLRMHERIRDGIESGRIVALNTALISTMPWLGGVI